MHPQSELILGVARERIAHDLKHADQLRIVREARKRHRISLRLRAARQLIQLGERLAAEPAFRPVRSR